jgi:hypothetical protein
MAIRTVFTMAEDCAAGHRQGWEEFVRDYAPLARLLLERYFPTISPELETHVAAVFQRARAHNSAWFRGLEFTNEREFMMAFRDLVMVYGREAARIPAPQISLDQLRDIMQDLSLVDRQMLWLFIRGYNAEQIGPIMANAATTAREVKRVADERLARVLPGSTPDAFTLSARVLMQAAEQMRGEECSSLKTFNNLVNGQISWREREITEEHMLRCFYCLDRFTTFVEMIRLRKDTPALPPAQVEGILVGLDLPAAKSKSMLARLFPRA